MSWIISNKDKSEWVLDEINGNYSFSEDKRDAMIVHDRVEAIKLVKRLNKVYEDNGYELIKIDLNTYEQ